MSRSLAFAVIAFVALLAVPRTSSAAGITFVESAYGLNFGCGSSPSSPACLPVDGLSNNCPFCYSSTTTEGLLSFNQSFMVGTNSVTFNAQTQSSYGELHAAASTAVSTTASVRKEIVTGFSFDRGHRLARSRTSGHGHSHTTRRANSDIS